jgi:hypothetical protein
VHLLDDQRGRLRAELHDNLRAHLEGCPACGRAEEAEQALTDLLERRLPQFPAPLGLKRRLAAQWPAPTAPRRTWWPPRPANVVLAMAAGGVAPGGGPARLSAGAAVVRGPPRLRPGGPIRGRRRTSRSAAAPSGISSTARPRCSWTGTACTPFRSSCSALRGSPGRPGGSDRWAGAAPTRRPRGGSPCSYGGPGSSAALVSDVDPPELFGLVIKLLGEA